MELADAWMTEADAWNKVCTLAELAYEISSTLPHPDITEALALVRDHALLHLKGLTEELAARRVNREV